MCGRTINSINLGGAYCVIDGEELLRVKIRQSDVDSFSEAIDFAQE
jgi:hypothetical protein